MGATIGKIMGSVPASLPRIPDFSNASLEQREWAAKLFFQKVGWSDAEFLRNRERPPFTSFGGIGIGEEAYEKAWLAEFDRRFLLRPATFVDTAHSLLVRPSCK